MKMISTTAASTAGSFGPIIMQTQSSSSADAVIYARNPTFGYIFLAANPMIINCFPEGIAGVISGITPTQNITRSGLLSSAPTDDGKQKTLTLAGWICHVFWLLESCLNHHMIYGNPTQGNQ